MQLNTFKKSPGKNNGRRLGRGAGSGRGKTCGRGHKGQKSRSGGKVQSGFEGGQMPLQRRLPKRGFTSRVSRQSVSLCLGELNNSKIEVVSLKTLKESGLIAANIRFVKIFNSGKLARAITVEGLPVTRGAREIIEKVGGKVVEG